MTDCVFCKIVSGDEPRHHVWEDDRFLAFLTLFPHRRGHLLIIPKDHVDYFFDMNPELYRDIFAVARKLHPVVRQVSGAIRVGMAVEGFGVAHAHLHLIPMAKNGHLDSSSAYRASEEELRSTSAALRQALT